jgi:Mn-dependent DtxR family transcriptional regulator
MAELLGVRRTTVTLVAKTLQKAGLIHYRRGHIRIQDLDGLRESACECYAILKAHSDRLLGTRHLSRVSSRTRTRAGIP